MMKKLFISIPTVSVEEFPDDELSKKIVARINKEGFYVEVVGKNKDEQEKIKQFINSGIGLTIAKLSAQAGFRLAQNLNKLK